MSLMLHTRTSFITALFHQLWSTRPPLPVSQPTKLGNQLKRGRRCKHVIKETGDVCYAVLLIASQINLSAKDKTQTIYMPLLQISNWSVDLSTRAMAQAWIWFELWLVVEWTNELRRHATEAVCDQHVVLTMTL